MRRRVAKVHWWRAQNQWSVVFSDHCEHYKELEIKAPMRTVLQDTSPKAYLKGRIAVIDHGDWAEIV